MHICLLVKTDMGRIWGECCCVVLNERVGGVHAALCMCLKEKEVKICGKNNLEWVKSIKLCVRDWEKLCTECVSTNYLQVGLVSCVEWQHCNENVGNEHKPQEYRVSYVVQKVRMLSVFCGLALSCILSKAVKYSSRIILCRVEGKTGH